MNNKTWGESPSHTMTITEAIDVLTLHGCPKAIQVQLLEAANFSGEICPETLEALVSNWIKTKHNAL